MVEEFFRALVDDISGRSGDRHEHGRRDVAILPCFGKDEGVGVLEAVRGQLVGLGDSFVFGYASSGHVYVVDFFELVELFHRLE